MRRTRRKLLIWVSRRGAIRLGFTSLILAVFVTWVAVDLRSAETWNPFALPLSGKVVVVDAGHGGVDGGAVSKDGLLEKQVNLLIAMYLRDYLQQAGAVVVMTREDDSDLADPNTKGLSKRKTEDLHNRKDVIQDSQADAFVSIHLNSIPSSQWHGAQTFYYPGRESSKQLATSIQNEIIRTLGNTDRAVNTASTIYLLKSTNVPSALVEVGFLSNPDEARLMANETYQKKMAAAVYHGILRYFSKPVAPDSGTGDDGED